MSDEIQLEGDFQVQSGFRPFVMLYHDALKLLNPYQLAAYVHLIKYANSSTSQAFPSTKRIADDVGISRRKVFSVLGELEEIGLISRKNRFIDADGQVSYLKSPNSKQTTSLIMVFDSPRKSIKESDPLCTTCTTPMHDVHTPLCTTCTTPMHDVHTITRYNLTRSNINNSMEGKPDSDKEKGQEVRKPYRDDFETFWKTYPRKIGDKRKAQDRFIKVLEEVSFDDLLMAVERFAEEVKRNRTAVSYIKHPSTWLNQACYLDYLRESSVKASSRDDRSAEFNRALDSIVGEFSPNMSALGGFLGGFSET